MTPGVTQRLLRSIADTKVDIPDPTNRIAHFENMIRLMQQQIVYLQREIQQCRRK